MQPSIKHKDLLYTATVWTLQYTVSQSSGPYRADIRLVVISTMFVHEPYVVVFDIPHGYINSCVLISWVTFDITHACRRKPVPIATDDVNEGRKFPRRGWLGNMIVKEVEESAKSVRFKPPVNSTELF